MFTSLFSLTGASRGLGRGTDGACHLVEIMLENLLPKDVQSGRLHSDAYLIAHDYGTHVGFTAHDHEDNCVVGERVISSYPALVQYIQSAYTSYTPVVVEEDAELDAQLEAFRRQAIAEVDGVADEDDDFVEDDEANEVEDMEDPDLDDDLTTDTEEDVELITITKPKAKAGSKKYKAEMNEIVEGLQDIFGVELDEAGVDAALMLDILEAMFDSASEHEIDPTQPIMDTFSEYVEFE